jgi:hypothetical protein
MGSDDAVSSRRTKSLADVCQYERITRRITFDSLTGLSATYDRRGLPPITDNREKSEHDARRELRARTAFEFGQRFERRLRVKDVRPARNHRMEGIGDGHDLRFDRNVACAESSRISASVRSLVMRTHDFGEPFESRRRGAHVGAVLRVASHDLEFARVECGGFSEDFERRSNLTDIVERAAAFDEIRLPRIPSEFGRESTAPAADASDVRERCVVVRFEAIEKVGHRAHLRVRIAKAIVPIFRSERRPDDILVAIGVHLFRHDRAFPPRGGRIPDESTSAVTSKT